MVTLISKVLGNNHCDYLLYYINEICFRIFMSEYSEITFESVIRDVLLDNMMLSVKSENAIAEVKIEKNTSFRIREQWATIGDEKGPWHIHVNIQETKNARFVVENKENWRKSYSIRFFNSKNVLVLRVNFMKMYNEKNEPIEENLSRYENLFLKCGKKDLLFLIN